MLTTINISYNNISLSVKGFYTPSCKGDSSTPSSPAVFEIYEIYHEDTEISDILSNIEITLRNSNKDLNWTIWEIIEELVINEILKINASKTD